MNYTPQEIHKNERLSIYNGAFSIIIVGFITNFIPLFAIEVLDASNTQVGLISSLPSIMIILSMIPGAIWMDRV